VQLTPSGKLEHMMQWYELREQFPTSCEYTPVKEDNDGWSTWQLWGLMNTFGHMMRPGCASPFLPDILINIDGQPK
jgi:hypothetical protein